MIELARHIEILLLSNDCVIVPRLGGFIAHHLCARYDELDGIYLPPQRTLAFNPQLTENDYLLAQSYIEAYDISCPEALRRIEDEVDELRNELNNNGCYELQDIGTLTLGEAQNICFEPCDAGILTPGLYGLSSVSFIPLGSTIAAPPRVESPTVATEPTKTDLTTLNKTETSVNDGDDDRTIHIKMSWIRNTVAIAAAVLAFFLITTPVVNSELGTSQQATIVPTPHHVTTTISQPKASLATVNETKSSTSQTIVDTPSHETTANEPDVPQAEKYTIVLASQVSRAGAEHFVKELHAMGYQQARIHVKNNIVRVIFGQYATQAEAYNQVSRLRDNEQFEDAWVYKL